MLKPNEIPIENWLKNNAKKEPVIEFPPLI